MYDQVQPSFKISFSSSSGKYISQISVAKFLYTQFIYMYIDMYKLNSEVNQTDYFTSLQVTNNSIAAFAKNCSSGARTEETKDLNKIYCTLHSDEYRQREVQATGTKAYTGLCGSYLRLIKGFLNEETIVRSYTQQSSY